MIHRLNFCALLSCLLLIYSTIAPAQIGIWTSAAELAGLPMSGPAWFAVLNGANHDISNPDVSNQSDNTNAYVLAAGIVYARSGAVIYQSKVVRTCEKLVAGGHPPGRTQAWARETGAYAMAADLAGYRTKEFEAWLRNMAEVYRGEENLTMLEMFKQRPNNVGSYAFGSLCAIYRYLGDSTRLKEIRDHWIQGVLGPNPGFKYGGDLSWHLDPKNPRLINPKGALIQGIDIDGIIPDDMRRGASLQEPPAHTEYPWGFIQGQIMAARILDRAGLPIWAIGENALYRAVYALHVRFENKYGGWAALDDDKWVLPFVDKIYGSQLAGTETQFWGHGKSAGWGYVVLGESRPKQYTLTVNKAGFGRVTLDPSGGIYNDGAVVKLTAIADSGWVFDHWSGDLTGSANPATLAINANKNVEATFLVKIGATIVLNPTEDGYIRNGQFAALNYNTESKLRVKEGPGDDNDYRAYLKFDLTGMRGPVKSASLKLYCQGLPNGSPTKAFIFAVPDDNWNESAITWNNAPAAASLLDSLTAITNPGEIYTFNVTGFVASELSGDKRVSLLVKDIRSTNKAVDFGRRKSEHPPTLIVETGVPTQAPSEAKAMANVIPQAIQLHQNYPNPFQQATGIDYKLLQSAHVKLVIYDVNGREVSTLVDGFQHTGTYAYVWEGVDAGGRQLPGGIYFCRIQSGVYLKTIKIILMK
jgi:hypothetical protein